MHHDADDEDMGEEYEKEEEEGATTNAIILHEDKKYYPTAEETYGPGVEALVQDEDAQPLEVPIVARITTKAVEIETPEGKSAVPNASPAFLSGLLSTPDLIRNVAVVGHLHHGKTLFMDMLVEQTHQVPGIESLGPENPMKFTDTRKDEQERGMSLKAVPMALVLESSRSKSYAMNIMDTPGHPNFFDEVLASIRLSDGVVLVVDAVEGVMLGTERAVKAAAAEGLPLCLIITKVDRLIMELKLPPADAYHKLKHTIQEVNGVVAAAYAAASSPPPTLDPVKGNVAFASPLYGWSFTLHSFAQLYANLHESPLDPGALAVRLWGDVWYHPTDRVFRRSPSTTTTERSFVQFILEPLYKVHSQILGEDTQAVGALAEELGVPLPPEFYGANVKPLLKEFLSRMFGSASGIVDMLVKHVPSPKDGAGPKVERCYTGPVCVLPGQGDESTLVKDMRACNPRGTMVLYVCKLFPKTDCSAFDVLARVMSGTVKSGDTVRVLGESFTPDDDEDSTVATVTAVWAYQGRYRVPLQGGGSAGAWVLLEGLDATISKTATIVPEFLDEDVYIMRPLPLQSAARAVVKIATEPLNPGELPKMVEGLRRLHRSYPALSTKVEESGEHTIFGTGELYLDSAMKDLRELYGDVEVKVADPVVSFCETVVETSSLKCFADSQNRKVRLTMVAEPLDKGLGEDIERGGCRWRGLANALLASFKMCMIGMCWLRDRCGHLVLI